MTKTEILRQSAAASNEKRVEQLGQQIETLRQTKHQNVEDLAAMLEPLAQAMAALTDETRQTMIEIDKKTKDQGDRGKSEMDAATQNWIKIGSRGTESHREPEQSRAASEFGTLQPSDN